MNLKLPTTPFSLGYRMPAEWQTHEATWLAWPKDPTTFPPDIINDVEQAYVKMIRALSATENVNVLVDDEETEERASSVLGKKNSILFHKIKTADVWIRDYGPIFIKGKDMAATKWIFNAWGNKYDDLKADDEGGMKVAQSTGFKIFEPGIVLEGGSIDVNGLGTCLTTKQCLLNKNRNPKQSAGKIAEHLRDYLGVTNLIWLDSGIAGDDTDGHVDDIARFVNEDTIVCMVEEDRKDENYKVLNKNYELLLGAKDQNGRKLNITTIQLPRRIVTKDGRLPASYANFYIGNAAVLVPTFNDPNDSNALGTLQELFPKHKIVGIDCESLVYGFGAIHCVTQQEPR